MRGAPKKFKKIFESQFPLQKISECAAKGGECDENKGRPVCGTDGQTYPTRCHLIRAQCSGHQVSLKHRGTCKGSFFVIFSLGTLVTKHVIYKTLAWRHVPMLWLIAKHRNSCQSVAVTVITHWCNVFLPGDVGVLIHKESQSRKRELKMATADQHVRKNQSPTNDDRLRGNWAYKRKRVSVWFVSLSHITFLNTHTHTLFVYLKFK